MKVMKQRKLQGIHFGNGLLTGGGSFAPISVAYMDGKVDRNECHEMISDYSVSDGNDSSSSSSSNIWRAMAGKCLQMSLLICKNGCDKTEGEGAQGKLYNLGIW